MQVYLTQRELEAALDQIVNELDNRYDNIDVGIFLDNIDVVYIPPEVDELTDEEDIDDNVVIEQFRPNEQEISGLFEIQNHNDTTNEDNIDVVYIPPEVDELTDEEDIDDNVVIEQFRPNEQEISGLFEIQNHNDTTNEGPIDSDDETLDVKRQKLLRQKVSAPVWKKGET
ncbi:hypothetical protein QE152_g12635 [Popillia japonica]|uniref:Uncharacterized protein n=1 Tax=Popillia japonica TaxID=7064 RepID=A0AAW1LQE6_POPJA